MCLRSAQTITRAAYENRHSRLRPLARDRSHDRTRKNIHTPHTTNSRSNKSAAQCSNTANDNTPNIRPFRVLCGNCAHWKRAGVSAATSYATTAARTYHHHTINTTQPTSYAIYVCTSGTIQTHDDCIIIQAARHAIEHAACFVPACVRDINIHTVCTYARYMRLDKIARVRDGRAHCHAQHYMRSRRCASLYGYIGERSFLCLCTFRSTIKQYRKPTPKTIASEAYENAVSRVVVVLHAVFRVCVRYYRGADIVTTETSARYSRLERQRRSV